MSAGPSSSKMGDMLVRSGLAAATPRLLRASLRLIDGIRRAERQYMRSVLRFEDVCVKTSVGPVRILLHRGSDARAPAWAFVHGFASRSEDWRPMVEHLLPLGLSILLIDLPGHGMSKLPEGRRLDADVLLPAACEALVWGMAALKNQRCVLLGNSLGGLVALRLASAPTKPVLLDPCIAALVLINPAGAPMQKAEYDALEARFLVNSRAEARTFVRNLYGSSKGLMGAFLSWGVHNHLNRKELKEMVELYRHEPAATPRMLGTLPPTLFIRGEADEFLPSTTLDYFKAHLAANRTEYLAPSKWGHTPFLNHGQYGQEVAARVIQWAHANEPLSLLPKRTREKGTKARRKLLQLLRLARSLAEADRGNKNTKLP